MPRNARPLDARIAGPTGKLRDVIRAAASLFAEYGYDATSMQQIADAVGIRKGSLYSHIDSKDDLLYGVTRLMIDNFRSTLERVSGDENDPLGVLDRLIAAHLGVLLDDLELARVYDRYWHRLTPDRKAAIGAEQEVYRSAVRRLIEQAQRSGQVAADRDPDLLAFQLLYALNSVLGWVRPRHRKQRVIEESVRTFRSGIVG